jgi:flagellin-like hook-associated protein FlgL
VSAGVSASFMPAIQLTPSVMSQQLISDLTGDQSSIAQLQQQLSTGNQVNQPSDNPSLAFWV